MQREAQRKLYEHAAPKLYLTCKRYLKNEEEAEEALADSFYKIFTMLDGLKDFRVFESWSKKIAVNICLMQVRKKVNFNMYLDDVKEISQPLTPEITDLEEDDLLNLLNFIPEGCRTIFNLFVVEGYSHREIASMLNISEGTSKSQFNVAKTKLKDLVNKMYYQKAK